MAEKTQIASKQTAFSLDKNTFSLPGYVFLGWSTVPGDTTAQYTDGQSVMFDDDTTLYAVWRPAQQVTITFDGNGAVDEHQEPYSETKLVYESSEIGELPTPTRVGYQFYGWWSDRTGGYPVTETTIVNASATYYARWASGSPGKGGATPHPCFAYDDNRFITGVHQVSPPNDYGAYSTAVVTQKHIYDDYALGIITLGGIAGRTTLEVLECPNVEYISQTAVNNVPLVRAIFPNLRQAGTNLFSNKGTLTYVDLGKIEEIPATMFANCSNLNNVTIPNTTTQIGTQAFYGCTSLESIIIPDSVTSIGDYAFYGCSSLASVTIGNGVTRIWQSAFRECSVLTSVTIPDNVTNIAGTAFYGCSNLAHLTLSQNLTEIGAAAFMDCDSLESVTIPASVATLSQSVFSSCFNLKSVYFDGDAPTGVASNTFSGVSAGAKAYVYSTAQGFPAEGSDWYGLIVEYRDAQTP